MANLSEGVHALGKEWRVQDNAIRLSSELGEKKGQEILLLRELRNWYRYFPEGSVFATDPPDFVVEDSNGRKVGLEITECLRGVGGNKKGSRHRERWAVEEKVKRLAEDLYYDGSSGNPGIVEPVWASLHWVPGQPARLPQSVEEIAAAVARLVRETEPEWRDGRLLEIGPERLMGTVLEHVLAELTVRRAFRALGGRGSPWGSMRSFLGVAAGVEDIKSAVSQKNSKLESWREKYDEAWLIVALGGGDSFQSVGEEVLEHFFSSRFDRVLLLCPDGGPGMRRVFELQVARY